MSRRSRWIGAGLLGAVALAAALGTRSAVRTVPRLFRRNAELKAQGYYMGEFEFKMLAVQHEVNRGRYLEAIRVLRRIEREMADPGGLARMPVRATPEQQMAFLLARQDPVTGAFMDPRYPPFTYFAPTCNVVEALVELRKQTGRPFRLAHPLRFLDRIGTPEMLRAYLDSLLYLDGPSARFPGPGPYGPGISELAAFTDLEEAGVHRFPDAWKTELRRWFYETQDPVSGFWGSRIGSPATWRQRIDVPSTFHILKLVLDPEGRDQDGRFPLRHADALARGILDSLEVPIPEDTAAQHDWGLKQAQGAKILVRYLWPRLPEAERERARRVFRRQLDRIFRLYRPEEGGFAYYTSAPGADLDGTGLALASLRHMGLLPGTSERDRLWGQALAAGPARTFLTIRRWGEVRLPPVEGVRSCRVYAGAGEKGTLVQIAYPGGAGSLDLEDLRRGLGKYLASGGPSFGNWTSAAGLDAGFLGSDRHAPPVTVVHGAPDLAAAARGRGASRFCVVGYDIAQIPLFRLVVTGA